MSSPPRPTVPRDGAVTIPARPENLPINPRETALIVVDMQNAYASPGGYLDRPPRFHRSEMTCRPRRPIRGSRTRPRCGA